MTSNAGQPETLSELYPRLWLKAEDLKQGGVIVTIEAVEVKDFWQPGGLKTPCAVLTFAHAFKRLICNKTQARAMARVCGSDRFADWLGHVVRLLPTTAPNGKATIRIEAANEEA